MCTQEEVKQAVIEVLHSPDANGGTFISKHIDAQAQVIVGKLTLRFGVAFVGMLLFGAASWYALYYQVQRHQEILQANSGYYTRSEQELYAQEVDRRFDALLDGQRDVKAGLIRIENILLNR